MKQPQVVSEPQEKEMNTFQTIEGMSKKLKGIRDVVKKVLYVICFPHKKKGKEIMKSGKNTSKK